MASCAGQGRRAFASHRPPAAARWRCTDGAPAGSPGPDPLEVQLGAVLNLADPARLTAGILDRLRAERLLPPLAVGMP